MWQIASKQWNCKSLRQQHLFQNVFSSNLISHIFSPICLIPQSLNMNSLFCWLQSYGLKAPLSLRCALHTACFGLWLLYYLYYEKCYMHTNIHMNIHTNIQTDTQYLIICYNSLLFIFKLPLNQDTLCLTILKGIKINIIFAKNAELLL